MEKREVEIMERNKMLAEAKDAQVDKLLDDEENYSDNYDDNFDANSTGKQTEKEKAAAGIQVEKDNAKKDDAGAVGPGNTRYLGDSQEREE